MPPYYYIFFFLTTPMDASWWPMTAEEFEIIAFLKQFPDSYFTRKEIARKARDKEAYEANPHWASTPLASLVMQGQVVQNDHGHYKLNTEIER